MEKELAIKFESIFKHAPEHAYFAPGRINLIGEHTDYNGGNVFPCSISLGTYGLVHKRNDSMINMYSENFPDNGIISFSLDELTYNKEDDWANYPKGMIRYIKELTNHSIMGFDFYVYGNIPNGAGLSSSASIELLTGVMLEDIWDVSISRVELVKLGKKVENEFIGVNSGIMDQFAIGMGKENQAILLDCATLEYDMVPVELDNQTILIMNTNKRRELADSKYNERRSECESALAKLQTELDIASLGELDNDTFVSYTHLINHPTLEKRARHAVTENQRTILAKQALVNNNLVVFGELLNASHASLKDDYEVTGIELDTLVELAQQSEGVIGARMTGAGFGGCAIALVENDKLDSVIEDIGVEYERQIGYPADFYLANIADGAKKIW